MIKIRKTRILVMLLLVMMLFLTSCKNGTVPEKSETATEEEKNRDLFSLSEIVTPSTVNTFEENLSGELIVLTEEKFILRVTDIDNAKGFQYKGKTPCIVDFHADWCRPCAQLNPILIELAKEYQGKVIFYKVNIDKEPNLTNAFGINSIPTLLFFKRHTVPTKIEGAPLKEELKNVIDEILLSENR